MKKNLMAIAAFFMSMPLFADYGFTINDFTIKAGEEKTIEVMMYHDTEITAFQFDLELPEGVEIKYDDEEEEYCVSKTSRLYNKHVLNVGLVAGTTDTYRFMVYHPSSTAFKGNSGNAILEITLVASDQVSTGNFTPSFTKVEMTEPNETQHKCADATYNCTVNINTTVTTLGYASFSWPKALDFTGTGLTAFIASSCNGSSLTLTPVTKVPANTGLILKGTAGSENNYQLTTTTDETDDVSTNLLSSNTTDVYTVASNDIYVLSNLADGQPGFYLANTGIHVGKYKSYLQLANASRMSLTFDESTTTGISEFSSMPATETVCYDLQGRRVSTPNKGIYVKNGKKFIAK